MVKRALPASAPSSHSDAAGPVRTCVGCRARAQATELLRCVAEQTPDGVRVVPDPLRRRPGRGAWLHPEPDCLALAERRRVFGRALRLADPPDLRSLREHLVDG